MLGNWTWTDSQWKAIVAISQKEKMHRDFSKNPNSLVKSEDRSIANKYARYMRRIAHKAETSQIHSLGLL